MQRGNPNPKILGAIDFHAINKPKPITDLKLARELISRSESAIARNIKFDLSFSKLKALRKIGKCFYTGKLINAENFSIDRKDNDIGYIDSNVVVCDKEFNMLKSNLTIDHIKILYKHLVQNPSKKVKNVKKNH